MAHQAIQSESEQGEALLDSTLTVGASLLGKLDPAADATLVRKAAAALGVQLQKLPAKGDAEYPVQQLLLKVLESTRDSLGELLKLQPGNRKPLVLWDTHQKGLTVGSRAISAKPHVLLCDRYKAAANVVSFFEAKPDLSSRTYQKQGALQIVQQITQSSLNSTPESHGGQGSSVQTLWTSGTFRQA